MITITRRLASQLRAVMRRAFGTRGPGPAVCFTASAGTLNVKASTHDLAVEYTGPTAAATGPAETLWVPFQVLDDCHGKRDDPVQLESTGKSRATAQWRDGSVPQIVQYDSPKPPAGADKFPGFPEAFAENPPGLLAALIAAGDTCDPSSVRYALGHLQLRGQQGAIVATDGRQMLIQGGLRFPWTEELLVPCSKVFASAELPRDEPVRVGKSGDWVALGVGRWAIYLRVNAEGRFPDVLRHVPAVDGAKARCSFSERDARFLAESLPRLPSSDEGSRPVTLDLDGRIAVRAKSSDSPRPTEVVLAGSSVSGESIRLGTNRDYLARALRLGFRELCITDNKSAVLALDVQRKYLWMPLDVGAALSPADDAVRIVSPEADPETPETRP